MSLSNAEISLEGDVTWKLNGKLHREDGPAVVYTNGRKTWYLEDKKYTEEEFNKKMNPKPTCEGKNH